MTLRAAAVLIIFLMTFIPTLFSWGPQLESRFRPVVYISLTNVATTLTVINGTESPVMYFQIDVEKVRPCKLTSLTFAWRFNHSAITAPVFVTTTNQVFQPPLITSPGEYVTPRLYTIIPLAAYGVRSVEFIGTLYYDCHTLWPIAQDVRIPIAIPEIPTKLIKRG